MITAMRLLFILFLLFSVTGAYAQTETLPVVPYRNTEWRRLASVNVGDTFQLYISLPDGYHPDSATRYAAIYLTDADYSFGMTKDIANYLALGKKIPPHILVGIAYGGSIGNWGQKRQRDFLPVANKDIYLSGGAPKFAAFLEQELVPYIDSLYRTNKKDRALIGMSYGGVFASYMLLRHPGVFKRYIVGTTPFRYENGLLFGYEKQYAETHKDMPAKVYASMGGAEHYALNEFDSFSKKLQGRAYKNLRFKAEVLPDEVHESVGGGTLARGLRWIYENYFYEDKSIAQLRPDVLRQYAGKYHFNGFNITIHPKEASLLLKVENDGSEMEIYPESETVFFSKKDPIEFRFQIENKKATGFTFTGKGEMHFTRTAESKGKK
jgi:predicted alpha/beta superfamily hydrolase